MPYKKAMERKAYQAKYYMSHPDLREKNKEHIRKTRNEGKYRIDKFALYIDNPIACAVKAAKRVLDAKGMNYNHEYLEDIVQSILISALEARYKCKANNKGQASAFFIKVMMRETLKIIAKEWLRI